ncbi:MAG: hypothetical protein QXZ68_05675 [Candidatus Bathyarchaeia archaeon]
MTSKDLQKTLLEAVEEGLAFLGESPKQAILFHLENTFKLRVEEIPENLKGFKEALEKIFGPGASYIERLLDKLNIKSETEGQDLQGFVENLRKRLLFPGDA